MANKKSKKSIDLSDLVITDKYGLGSFLKENIVPAGKLAAGLALGPAGVPLAVSGGADLAGNIGTEATGDPAAQQLAQVGGQAANLAMMNPKLENGGDLTQYNGNTHEEGGIALGGNAEVEDKETRWEDYIFSEKLKVPGKKYSFSDASKRIDNKYNKRKNDKYDAKAKEREMKALMGMQEAEREKLDLDHQSKMEEMFGCGGDMSKHQDGGELPIEGLEGTVEGDGDDQDPWYLNPETGTYENRSGTIAPTPEPIPGQVREEVNPGIVYEDGQLKLQRTGNTTGERLQLANPRMATLYAKSQGLQGDLTHKQLMEGFTKDPQGMINTLFPQTQPVVQRYGGKVKAQMGLTPEQLQAATQAINPDMGALEPYLGNKGSLVGTPNYVSPDEPNTAGMENYVPEGTAPTQAPTSGEVPTSGTAKDLGLLLAQNLGNIGNIALGTQGSDPVNVGRVDPAVVSYQQALENVRKSYDQASNVARENIRRSATGSGQSLSNQIAANTSLTKDKAAQLAQISEQEQNINAQARGQADVRNQMASMREEDLNQRGKGASQQALMTGLSGLGTSIAGYSRDKKADTMQKQYIQNLLNTGEYRINPQTKEIEYIGNQTT